MLNNLIRNSSTNHSRQSLRLLEIATSVLDIDACARQGSNLSPNRSSLFPILQDSTTQPHPPTLLRPRTTAMTEILRAHKHIPAQSNIPRKLLQHDLKRCANISCNPFVRAGAGANTPSVPSLGTLTIRKVFCFLHDPVERRVLILGDALCMIDIFLAVHAALCYAVWCFMIFSASFAWWMGVGWVYSVA